MQVYNLSHAFGLFSFVDPMIVRSANFSVGGFQAEYGGRLSSVFDIQTIDGDKNEFEAKGTLDLLSSDAMLTFDFSAMGKAASWFFIAGRFFKMRFRNFILSICRSIITTALPKPRWTYLALAASAPSF